MRRLTEAEVLRRYEAGERDFRGADLSGLRFRGATLAGADFSGTDLRGTDFFEADLRGAKFVGTRFDDLWFGRTEKVHIIVFLLGALGGLFLAISVAILIIFLFSRIEIFGGTGDVLLASCVVSLFVAGQAIFAWEGFNPKGICWLAFTYILSVSVYQQDYIYIAGAVSSAIAVSVILSSALVGSVFSLNAIAGCSIGIGLTIVLSAFSASHFATSVAGAGLGAVVIAGFYLAIAVIAFQRSRQGAIGYVGVRSFGIALGALGGTRFSGADLRGSFFTGSQLAGVNFAPSRSQVTRLERVCWKGARGLDHAITQGTILDEPRSRSLLLSGSAQGADLHGLNLRGAFLPHADLRAADLRETNLSEAVLTQAHMENSNLKASQCLGTDLSGAHLTGATLEGWNIDHATELEGVDCDYVYLLEPLDAYGQRRDDHHRERLPHDADKSFGPGDFETYFKQLIEEVKLLIKNGVDAKAFQQAFQEVMHQHPQITLESISGFKKSGDDVIITLQTSASVDKGAVEKTFFAKYNAVMLENVRLKGLLAGERRVAEVERERATQFAELASRLVPLTQSNPYPTTVMNTTIHAGDGNLINTGSLNTAGGMVNLGDFSDQAQMTIEALPDQRSAEGQPTLRELLQELKASVEADTQVPESTLAEALTEVTELAKAAQDPQKNASPARRAINSLKGLSAGLTEANKAMEESSKLVAAVSHLLPLIAGFFLG